VFGIYVLKQGILKGDFAARWGDFSRLASALNAVLSL
jgi:hypothetical protein